MRRSFKGAKHCPDLPGLGYRHVPRVWYSLTATADTSLVAETLGSDYDTIIDIWEGTLTNDLMNPGFETLKPLACNDNGSGSLQSEVVFAALIGQRYVIRVTTALDATGGSLAFHLRAA